jgi:hypothetical protein
MPIQAPVQVYLCPVHGEFEVKVPFSEDVPSELPCARSPEPWSQTTACGLPSRHVLKPIAAAIVEGGTGARRSG